MRKATFIPISKAFSLPFFYLQMLEEYSTVLVDVQNVSTGSDKDILSIAKSRIRSVSIEGGSRSPNIHEVAKD